MKKLMPIALAGLLLAGCGGGGGDAPRDATEAVPSEASQSTGGLIAYLKRLVASTNAEGKEPVSVDAFDPKRPDDEEPVSL